jgi:hypothetical protein
MIGLNVGAWIAGKAVASLGEEKIIQILLDESSPYLGGVAYPRHYDESEVEKMRKMVEVFQKAIAVGGLHYKGKPG